MLNILISVGSYAFQVAGAIILLLWSLSNCDIKIKQMAKGDEISWGGWDSNGTYLTLKKENLQESAEALYKNIVAFIDLLIGYGLAIFMTDVAISRICILVFVSITVIIILAIEFKIVHIIALKKYPTDIKQ